MASMQDTAYPRLKSTVCRRDLDAVYTPTWDETIFVNQASSRITARGCFLILLKTFQRLGYFLPLAEVPPVIVTHIAHAVRLHLSPEDLRRYDASGTRKRTPCSSASAWVCARMTPRRAISSSLRWTGRRAPRRTRPT